MLFKESEGSKAAVQEAAICLIVRAERVDILYTASRCVDLTSRRGSPAFPTAIARIPRGRPTNLLTPFVHHPVGLAWGLAPQVKRRPRRRANPQSGFVCLRSSLCICICTPCPRHTVQPWPIQLLRRPSLSSRTVASILRSNCRLWMAEKMHGSFSRPRSLSRPWSGVTASVTSPCVCCSCMQLRAYGIWVARRTPLTPCRFPLLIWRFPRVLFDSRAVCWEREYCRDRYMCYGELPALQRCTSHPVALNEDRALSPVLARRIALT
jgi:hypothetical protein